MRIPLSALAFGAFVVVAAVGPTVDRELSRADAAPAAALPETPPGLSPLETCEDDTDCFEACVGAFGDTPEVRDWCSNPFHGTEPEAEWPVVRVNNPITI